MLNHVLKFGSSPTADFITKLLISLIIAGAIAPVTIDLTGELPITLQSLALLLPAILFGWKIGGLTNLLYIVFGGLGAPVFATHSSGWEHVFGVSGGFFFGFLFASILCGFLAEFPRARHPLFCFLIWVSGHILILMLGGFWLMPYHPDGVWPILQTLLPGAAAKSAAGLLLCQITLRILVGRNEFYGVK